MTWYPVDVKEDHLNSLMGKPIKGIEELIWNSLDADASEVGVTITQNGLGGIEAVRVVDDGSGMTPKQAVESFEHLGGSWKARQDRSPGNRPLHGKAGQGRWRAFGIGNLVRWETVSIVEGKRILTVIKGRREQPNGFEISDPEETDRSPGTTVVIDSFSEPPAGLLGDSVATKLTTTLALALAAFDVTVTYDGSRLDPSSVQLYREEYPIELSDGKGEASLTVIEWSIPVERSLYLCDAGGASLQEVRPQIHAPGFDFTGYVRWDGFAKHLHNLSLAEWGGNEDLDEPIEKAKELLRDHFRDRSSEATKRLIEDWKTDEAYPYQGEPQSTVERAERQVFDVVALAAAKAVTSSSDKKARRLSLNLIKVALENDPGSLQDVLGHVLDLPAERVDELRQLLEQTSLTSLITAARTITNRLSFLRAFEILVFDPETRGKLRERTQLHRILANETWIFGEEYALAADDESLNTVLTRHLELLGRERMADEEVLDEDGKRKIVDLMLARSIEQAQNRREHLVVELKAPSLKVGPDEMTQIKKYAFTVAEDSRFDTADVRWDFVLVTGELNSYAENERNQSDREPGLLVVQDRLRVWVKTWAEIIQSAEHRMKFVQKALNYSPSSDEALKYLQLTHEKYLPDSLKSPEPLLG
jgi:hypothetical protein